jgi:hypothetical protein
MSEISKSPDRHTFQREGYVKRLEEKGETPDADYLDYFQKIIEDDKRKFDDPESRKNNMEYDLVTTDWILDKVRIDDAYAQNLYAAMCNNGFIKLEVIPVLKGEEWTCSWRYAGGIIADMQQKGDYINWYCSGIRNDHDMTEEEQRTWTDEQKARFEITKRYVGEGCITDEIRNDLQRLGWTVASGGDWKNF